MTSSRIEQMCVNGRVEPLAVEGDEALFTWSVRTESVVAGRLGYRLVIAASEKELTDGPVLYTSSHAGAVDPCREQVSLRGLRPATMYWWSVCVRDESGQEWTSAPARFHTAPDASQLAAAQWIWTQGERIVNDYQMFRREVRPRGPLVQATAYASACHYMQVYLDGKRVSGYGSPVPSNPEAAQYYVPYDLLPYLGTDAFCLSATVHYLGGSGQNYVNGIPGFWLLLMLRYEDGTSELVTTDPSWRAKATIPYERETDYQQNRRLSAVERYDARREDKAWLYPGYPDQHELLPVREEARSWPMRAQPIPEGAVRGRIQPIPVSTQSAGIQVFDTGYIVSGWVRLVLHGVPGTVVRIRYSENLDEAGRVGRNVCNEPSEHYYDEYTMHGKGEESVEADFAYKAFRYVEITGYPELLGPGQIEIIHAHTDTRQAGSFNCSDPNLDKLAEACLLTQRNNLLGQVVDCPHREQAQYLADTDLQAEALLVNFDGAWMLDKALADFAGGQLENGTFPFVYPSNYEHPDFHIRIPEWDLHFVTLMDKLYIHNGDQRMLKRYTPVASRMMDYYLGKLDAQAGLLPKDDAWHISDWPYPTIDQDGPYLTVQNCKFYGGLRRMALFCSLLGEREEEHRYGEAANRLQASIVRHLYDSAQNRFVDSYGTASWHQGTQAVAIENGLFPSDGLGEAMAAIGSEELHTRTLLSLSLLRVLFDHGQSAAAFRHLASTDYPGWGYMIAQGAKTMWEGFEDIESHCHAWNGYPLRLLQEYIAGIRITSPGALTVRIKPYVPDQLNRAAGRISTIRGEVSTGWHKRGDGEFGLEVRLPPGMKADIHVPLHVGAGKSITMNGQLLWNGTVSPARAMDGKVPCREEEGDLVVEVYGGLYQLATHSN